MSVQQIEKATLDIIYQQYDGTSLFDILSGISPRIVDELANAELTSDSIAEVQQQLQPLFSADSSAASDSKGDFLHGFIACLDKWAELSSKQPADVTLWTLLANKQVQYRNVMLMLHILSQSKQPVAFTAATAYLKLLQVSGNFNVMNPIILREALNLAKLWARFQQENNNSKKPEKGASKRKAKAAKAAESDEEMDAGADDDEAKADPFEGVNHLDSEQWAWLGAEETAEHVASLMRAATVLLRCSGSGLSLQKNSDLFALFATVFVDVTQAAPGEGPAIEALTGLEALLLPLNGDPAVSFNLVLKKLLPCLLCMGSGLTKATVPKRASAAQSAFADWVIRVAGGELTATKKKFWPALLFLLQHLCVRASDRAAFRNAVVKTIFTLVTAFPLLFHHFSAFLIKFSRNSKVAFRVLAVELAASMLRNPELLAPSALSASDAYQLDKACSSAAALASAPNSAPASPEPAAKPAKAARAARSRRAKAAAAAEEEDSEEEDDRDEHKEMEDDVPAEKEAAVEEAPVDEEKRQLQAKGAQNLLEILLSRCSDKAPTVRSKALTLLADAVTAASETPALRMHLAAILASSRAPGAEGSASPMGSPGPSAKNASLNGAASPEMSLLRPASLSASGAGAASVASPLTLSRVSAAGSESVGLRSILRLLHRRSADPRPVVRKASIQAIEALLLTASGQLQDQSMDASNSLAHAGLTADDLQVFFDGCCDTSLAIRKQALSSISRLFQAFSEDSVMQKVWLGAVLPLSSDPESTVQDKVLDYVQQMVFDPMLKALKQLPLPNAIWRMIGAVNADMVSYLQHCVSLMIRKKSFPDSLINQLNKVLSSSTERAVWIVAEELSKHIPKRIDAGGVAAAWHGVQMSLRRGFGVDGSVNEELAYRVLNVIANLAPQAKTDVIEAIMGDAVAILNGMTQTSGALEPARPIPPPSVIKSLVKAARAIFGSMEPHKAAAFAQWESDLTRGVQGLLENYVFQQNTRAEPHHIGRALFLLGEISLLSAGAVAPSAQLVSLVQALMAPALSHALAAPSQLPAEEASASTAPVPPPSDQILTTEVRAHAFIALGKMCLKSEKLAKQCVAVFVRELETGTDPVLRNNVLIIMTDLARTFTQVVDNYLISVTRCLRDKNAVIRRHTVMVLSQLLQEDYIKWKGNMFLRLLSSVMDDSEMVRTCAEQSLSALLASQPGRFQSHFVESIFYYNDCHLHPQYNQQGGEADFALSDRPGQPASLKTAKKRMALYRFMLKFMGDEQKFNTVSKLCHDVLAAVVDGQLSIDAVEGQAVLRDALIVLASRNIKLSSLKSSAAAAAAAEAEDAVLDNAEGVANVMAEAAQEASGKAARKVAVARGKILSQLVKKNTLENIVPVLIELKHLLERKQSSILRYLMFYFKELLNDYSQELEDILAADKQLATELKFDLEQFEQQQKAQNKQQKGKAAPPKAAAAAVASTPGPASRSAPAAFGSPQFGFNLSGDSRRLSLSSVVFTPARPRGAPSTSFLNDLFAGNESNNMSTASDAGAGGRFKRRVPTAASMVLQTPTLKNSAISPSRDSAQKQRPPVPAFDLTPLSAPALASPQPAVSPSPVKRRGGRKAAENVAPAAAVADVMLQSPVPAEKPAKPWNVHLPSPDEAEPELVAADPEEESGTRKRTKTAAAAVEPAVARNPRKPRSKKNG